MGDDADTKIPVGSTLKEEAEKEAPGDLEVEPLAPIPAAPFPVSLPLNKDIIEAKKEDLSMEDFLEIVKKDEAEEEAEEDKEVEPPAAFEFPPPFPTTNPQLVVKKTDAKDANATFSVAKIPPSIVKTPDVSKPPTAMEASPGASGAAQVKALMGKNLLTKIRTPGATLAELISPVLLMVVLWISYNMTDTMFFPASYYHALNVDLPLFWDTGAYGEEEFDQMDMSDTHRRRHLGKDVEDIMQGEDETWTWSQLLKDMSSGSGSSEGQDQEEEMGLINDFFMMNHLKHGRHLQDEEDDWMTGSADWMAGSTLEDDTIDLDEKQGENDDDEEDSGDWYEEIMTDLKKETIDKVDWDEVVDEIQDNFGDMWDNAKDFIVTGNGRGRYGTLNILRLRLKDFLRRPMVVPTFGQYIWASNMLSSFFNVKKNMPRALEDSSYGRQWGNLLTLGTVHLVPRDHPMTSKLIDYLKETYPAATKTLRIRVHDDQDNAMTYVMEHLDDERTWAVIDLSQLHDSESSNDEHGGSFMIRLNHTTVPNTALVENYVASGLSTKYQRYYLSGYLTLQRTINDFVLSESGCTPEVDPFFSMPMPTAAYDQNLFFMHVGYLMGLILVMAFLYPTSRLIQSLVEERETRMKETLLILGVRPWAHTTSWVLTSAISFVCITFFMAIILRNVLTHTEFSLLWFWLALFGMASMSFCFFLSSFFSKAKLAAVIGPMALFASLLPRFIFFGTNRYEAIGAKYIASILPGTALAFGADIVGDYEYGEQSVSSSFWVGDYSFGTSIFFLAFDTVLYMVLAWYTEQVVPREYGAAPKPWYFPFVLCIPSALLSRCISADKTLASEGSDDDLSVASMEKFSTENDCIESVTDPALIPRVFINNLVKRYNNKAPKPAVNDLNLTLYESQIVGLLGHNGAGKTSTVAMLTGLYPPTSGDISIYGHSIVDDLAKARQSIGICPQHDVLFDRLTVMEHLTFFSKIKGVSSARSELKERALEIGLTEDQLRTTASALSGGNKRKLSVAIALCGNPKFLILDEPTSAMDPTARRRCWQVLRKQREGRVTLLTTHFMDEAEHLSDRVAVMKEGELQCCGSPLYLKDRYNLGWNLTVVMEKPEDDAGIEHEYANSQDRITSFLQQFIPLTKLVRRSGRELTYCFPKGSEELFPGTFDAFEQQVKDLGVTSYGIENASFEEVFLMLAEKEDNQSEAKEDDAVSTAETGSVITDGQSVASSSKFTADLGDTASDSDSDSLVSSDPKVPPLDFKDTRSFKSMSPLRQIGLMYWKRATVQKRDIKGAFFAIIVPVVLVALVILVLTASVIVSGPPREISPAMFENSYSAASSENANTQILVGGGASAGDQDSVQSKYLFMDSGLSYSYPKAQVERLEEAKSSAEMSNFLLDTYNNHDHPARFGAFSFEDEVQLNVNLNFSAFREQMDYYSTRRVRGAIKLRDQRVDLLEVFGFAGRNGRLFWKTNAAEIAKNFYRWSGVDPGATVRTADLHDLARTALDAIMKSSNQELEQVRSEYEAGVRKFVNETYDSVVSFLESSRYSAFVESVGVLATDVADNAKLVFNQSHEIESDLEIMVKDLVHAAFQRLPSQKVGKNKEMRDIYRLDAELEPIVRNFVNDLGSLGKNPERGIPSIYELAQDFVQNVTKLANQTISEVTDGSYTADSMQSSLVSAFQGISNGEDFDRNVVIREVSTMIASAAKLYKLGNSETEETIRSAIRWVDERLLDYSDGSIQRIPAKVFVAPLIFAEYILGKWDTETISPREAFGYFSQLLGGSKWKLDGFVLVEAKDITIDFGKVGIEFNNIWIHTARGKLFSMDREFSLAFALDALQTLAPNTNNTQFQFGVPSKTSLLHNSSSAHAVAVFNQAYMENRFKTCLGETRSATARLVSVNHPLPLTAKQSLEIKIMLSVLAGLFILIPFCYIPATFIVFLVKERVSKSKHLQLVSGVNMSAYWIATYLWDLTLYFLLTMCIMCVFLIYGSSAEVFVGSKDAFLCTFALTFGYGVSALPFSYLLSRMFDNSSTAQISVAGIGWLTGFVTVISYVTMDSLEKTQHIAAALQPWFRLFPAYNVGEGLMSMSYAFWYREILGWDQHPLDWDIAGHSICYIFLLALPYCFLVLVLEYSDDGGSGGLLGRGLRAVFYYWNKLVLKFYGIRLAVDEADGAHYSLLGDDEQAPRVDGDVAEERQYVNTNSEVLRQSAPVVMLNLWKIYPPSVGVLGSCIKRVRQFFAFFFRYCYPGGSTDENDEKKASIPKQAVRGVSTVIKKGETYALLGANGAGKTTTMGMLTGDITSTSGSAYIAGHDATGGSNSGVSEARKNIGFCPQKDPLLDLMTGRETLTMFARLRGVPPAQVDALVEELLGRLTLTPHADKITKAYSGGNKRKLSLGLALIGDPKVLLIDESSSGLDPLAKRRMWDLIEEAARTRSVILTTHSMQEAEALCTRVAIMVKGQFVCLGSVQHLKSKYMDGYSVDMFCKSSASIETVDRVENEVLYALPGCHVSERHGRFLRFEVSNVSCLGLGTCFRRLQELKNNPELLVENYSVSQCSLEHVFVKLVNNDQENDANEDLENSSSFSKASI